MFADSHAQDSRAPKKSLTAPIGKHRRGSSDFRDALSQLLEPKLAESPSRCALQRLNRSVASRQAPYEARSNALIVEDSDLTEGIPPPNAEQIRNLKNTRRPSLGTSATKRKCVAAARFASPFGLTSAPSRNATAPRGCSRIRRQHTPSGDLITRCRIPRQCRIG
jgi:hypothetical protein